MIWIDKLILDTFYKVQTCAHLLEVGKQIFRVMFFRDDLTLSVLVVMLIRSW